MVTVDIDTLVQTKARDLLARSTSDAWAACAAVWARLYVLAARDWARWPDVARTVLDAFSLAMGRSAGVPAASSAELILVKLDGFAIEDDGSAEWQFVVDLIAMLSTALHDQELKSCLMTTLSTYLEGTFNVLGNKMAVEDGRSIPHSEVKMRLAQDEAWRRAVEFVRSL
jgi:hypothetical protein